MKRNNTWKRWVILLVCVAAYIWLVSDTGLWRTTLSYLFPSEPAVLHPRAPLWVFVIEHLRLVGISSGVTILIGVPLGIWVTRPGGQSFSGFVNSLTSFGQTFPPVAVLALAVPVLGFGLWPTVVALFLYGILPVVRNTTSGVNSVPRVTLDAAYGMGMSRLQALYKVELPLAMRVIITGIRISVIINIGTAMVGAVIGAGGLGSPIVAGLVQNNLAFVLEGAVPAAVLAILVDQLFSGIEDLFAYPNGNR